MNLPFAKREFDTSKPEMMDQEILQQGRPSPELERDLANLRWLNLHFGAISLLHHFLDRWFSHRPETAPTLRILDLATGEGDLPRAIVLWCRARNLSLQIDAVDLNEATMSVARRRSCEFPEIHFHQGDIRSWQRDDTKSGEYDLVLCCLALHHFSREDAVRVLCNARRLTSLHLLVADLERSFLGAIGIYLLTSFILREPMTRHDAQLSMRRAFSSLELVTLAQDAAWEGFCYSKFPITRQAIWIDRVSDKKYP